MNSFLMNSIIKINGIDILLNLFDKKMNCKEGNEFNMFFSLF
jgi:hypothetical protein